MKKQQRIHIKVPAIYVEKLAESFGLETTAKELGVGTSAIAAYIRAKKASVAMERAAKSVWDGINTPLQGSNTALIKGDKKTLEVIKNIVELSKGNFTVI